VLEWTVTAVAGGFLLYSLLVRARADRAAGLRLAGVWACVLGAVWVGGYALPSLAVVLLVWPLARPVVSRLGFGSSLKRVDVALASEFYRDRERAIWHAAELANDEAWTALASHLANERASDEEDELLTVFRALAKGWGAQVVSQRWEELPARARAEFLRFARGTREFPRNDLLWLARRGMDDEDATIAARAWEVYEAAVRGAVQEQAGDFDVYAWIQGTTDDPHPRIEELRRSLIDGLRRRTQDEGVDALAAEYKRTVFIEARAARVRLRVSRERTLTDQHGASFELPVGLHAASLTGRFDNAQNRVQEGWCLECILDEVAGARRRLVATWHAEELFEELLSPRHDGRRVAFEDASATLTNAFATQAFVGPIAVYGAAWDRFTPRYGGAEHPLLAGQIQQALVARVEEPDGAATLAFLHHEVRDEDEDETEPFVTLVPLERLLLEELEDPHARTLEVLTD